MIIRRKTESYMKFGLNLFWNSVGQGGCVPSNQYTLLNIDLLPTLQSFACRYRDVSLYNFG